MACFSSIIGNMRKTKADFELSACSVKTYYFKVRMSQPKRGHSQLFLKLCFLKHTPKYQILKKGLMISKVNQPEAKQHSNVFLIITTFPPTSQRVNLTANLPGDCDKQFNSFDKCKDINITNVLKYITVAQRSTTPQRNSEINTTLIL